MFRSRLVRCLDRLRAVPTAVHLWCAERVLRLAPGPASPRLRRARRRNLALLRLYRRRGEFPRNTTTCPRPCFVDAGGRHCAVAFLMSRSGGQAVAGRVAATANHARVRDLRGVGLEEWAGRAGLSVAELARVQPMYPPSPAASEAYLWQFCTVSMAGAMAANAVVFNLARLAVARRPRHTTAGLGVLAGGFLAVYSATAGGAQFAHTTPLSDKTRTLRNVGFVLGAGCAWALLAVVRRRTGRTT